MPHQEGKGPRERPRDASPNMDAYSARHKPSQLAFCGFVPVYPRQLADRSGRQRVSVYWGEQALDGIKHDSVELVRNALRQKATDPQHRVEATGLAGAPFSYANAAFFTQEQIDRVVDDLKTRAREANAKARRYVSDSEWVSIDQACALVEPATRVLLRQGVFSRQASSRSLLHHSNAIACLFEGALEKVGAYSSAFISRATAGDTGLHLAITLGSLRAAEVFVEEGCDVIAVNDDGIRASDILSENFQKIMKLVEHIAQLEEDYTHRGTIAHHLTPREKACLGEHERIVRKANQYRLFAHGMACYFFGRLSVLAALKEEASVVCKIERRDLDVDAARKLSLRAIISRHQEKCEAIRDWDHPTLPQLDPLDLERKAETFTTASIRAGDRDEVCAVSTRSCENQYETQSTRDGFIAEQRKVGDGASLTTRIARCIAPPTPVDHAGISVDTNWADSGGAYVSQLKQELYAPDTVATFPSTTSTLTSNTVDDPRLSSPMIG